MQLKKVLVIAVCCLLTLCVGSAFGLSTLYDNSGGYNVVSGYDNKIPYEAFFTTFAPTPEKIKVQKGDTQAIIPIHQKEQKIEQKGLKEE